MKEHSLWIEKYRSKELAEYIGNNDLKEKMEFYIKQNDIPHLLFTGPAGTGKTTMAKLLVGKLNCDWEYINASDENGIETIREKIKKIAEAASFKPLKVIILDEADFLTQPAQAALRAVMEEYSLNTRYILTCNYVEKIIEPVLSRCELYKLIAPPGVLIAKHIKSILDENKIKYDKNDIVSLVKEYYPDIRSILKIAQKCSRTGELILIPDDKSWLTKLVTILSSKSKKAWSEIRQLIADNNVDDFQQAYKYLWENLVQFSNGHDAEISILLDEFSYRAHMVPDKEINFAAFCAKLLETI